MYRGFKYEIYLSEEQKELFWKTVGCNRLIWNLCLDHCKKVYEKEGKNPSYFDLCNFIKVLRETKKYSFLKEIDILSLRKTAGFLKFSFIKFFQKQGGFPKYKSKKNPTQSFTTDSDAAKRYGNLDFKNHTVVIPKFGKVHSYLYRKFKGNIKRATIKYEGCRYWISYIVEVKDTKPLKPVKQECGIDLGVKDTAVIYHKNKVNGKHFKKVKNPKFLEKTKKKIRKLQWKLSRKQKGSNNYHKVQNKLNISWFHLRNQRKDFLHKLSNSLIHENQVIYIEDLNIKSMMKKNVNTTLKDNISDASWYLLRSMLEYKSDESGRHIEVIDSMNTSRICWNCGFINKDLALKDRQWSCPCCCMKHDRDKNAAKNIFKRGYNQLYRAGV